METYHLLFNGFDAIVHLPCCNRSVLCQKKLKNEASKPNSSGGEYSEYSEYEKDKSSYSDTDNITGAKQYDF